MGRAFLFIGHGEIYKALHLNQNSLLAFSLVFFLWINGVLSLIFKKEITIRMNFVEKGVAIGLVTIFILGVWFNTFKM
jgi:hypothetical protein